MPSERINARPIILSVGRIIEYKGFDRLVDVLYQLHKDGKDFCAYIVGDGNLREALVQRVCLLGMTEKIIFTGSLSSEKVQEYYKRADIFVFAGSVQKGQYGLPNVLVEAMSAGLAVLTTALPTAVEIIESGKNGLVVIDDDEMLYEGLSTLVGDAELREHLGKEARKKALMQFSIEANTKTLYDLFVKSANEQAVK